MEFILRITVSHYKAYACNLNCMKIYVVGLLSFFFLIAQCIMKTGRNKLNELCAGFYL